MRLCGIILPLNEATGARLPARNNFDSGQWLGPPIIDDRLVLVDIFLEDILCVQAVRKRVYTHHKRGEGGQAQDQFVLLVGVHGGSAKALTGEELYGGATFKKGDALGYFQRLTCGVEYECTPGRLHRMKQQLPSAELAPRTKKCLHTFSSVLIDDMTNMQITWETNTHPRHGNWTHRTRSTNGTALSSFVQMVW